MVNPKKKMKKKKYVNSGTVSSHPLSDADVDFLSPRARSGGQSHVCLFALLQGVGTRPGGWGWGGVGLTEQWGSGGRVL